MSQVIDDTLKLADNGVVLFSKSYCPYCRKAKRALKGINITPVVVELDERDDGKAIQEALLERTGQRTVPSAWFAGRHIGGSEDVVAGIGSGLFESGRTGEKIKQVEEAGLEPCGKGDGLPCLCQENV